MKFKILRQLWRDAQRSKFYDKQRHANFNPARQSGDGCIKCNLIYKRAAAYSRRTNLVAVGSFGIEFHTATHRLVKFSSTMSRGYNTPAFASRTDQASVPTAGATRQCVKFNLGAANLHQHD
ncbi:hypothetical protein [uncultured Campylobacter sp.]|uniref:hypothetical protein n=1 Tax=uncultured Campylobacter sp. TaxID=218934 RepID=UPI00262FE57B|nr:hypothetical protein [uncultured Campylobacter sp.]